MTSASFRQHFDMISMHEPVQRKAKFWTSYVRALKGTEDMRAEEGSVSRRRPRPFSEIPDLFPSHIFEDSLSSSILDDPASRIRAAGYRYQPVSRETYGHTPRAIQPVATPSRRSRV